MLVVKFCAWRQQASRVTVAICRCSVFSFCLIDARNSQLQPTATLSLAPQCGTMIHRQACHGPPSLLPACCCCLACVSPSSTPNFIRLSSHRVLGFCCNRSRSTHLHNHLCRSLLEPFGTLGPSFDSSLLLRLQYVLPDIDATLLGPSSQPSLSTSVVRTDDTISLTVPDSIRLSSHHFLVSIEIPYPYGVKGSMKQ